MKTQIRQLKSGRWVAEIKLHWLSEWVGVDMDGTMHYKGSNEYLSKCISHEEGRAKQCLSQFLDRQGL